MNLPVSTYYKLKYKAVLQPSEQEMDIRDKLERLAVEFPGYGYRRMTAALRHACHEYTEYLQDHEFGISMSRRGNCYDNAKAESFFKTLKREEVWLNDYQTIADVKKCMNKFRNI